MWKRLPVLAAALVAACSTSPYKDGPTLGEDPNLLGPNITEEIRRGEFFVGPGDMIAIEVFGHPEYNKKARVDPDCEAFFFQVGKIDVCGQGLEGVRDTLTKAYARLLVDPSLDVTLEGSRMRKVTVLGQVAQPGVFPMSTPRVTVLDILAEAGGVEDFEGDKTGILVARNIDGVNQVKAYDMDLFFLPSDPDIQLAIPYVHPGDVVYVLRTWQAEYVDSLDVIRDTLRTLILGERLVRGTATLDLVIN